MGVSAHRSVSSLGFKIKVRLDWESCKKTREFNLCAGFRLRM